MMNRHDPNLRNVALRLRKQIEEARVMARIVGEAPVILDYGLSAYQLSITVDELSTVVDMALAEDSAR